MKNFIGIFITVFVNLMGIVGFWFTFKNKKNAVIAILILATISLVIDIVCIYRELKAKEKKLQKVQHELKDVKHKHKELSKQFNMKKYKLTLYENNWILLDSVFLNAIQSSDEKRFNNAYEVYRIFTNTMNAKGE